MERSEIRGCRSRIPLGSRRATVLFIDRKASAQWRDGARDGAPQHALVIRKRPFAAHDFGLCRGTGGLACAFPFAFVSVEGSADFDSAGLGAADLGSTDLASPGFGSIPF